MRFLCVVTLCVLAGVVSANNLHHRHYEVYDLAKAPEYFEKFIKDYNRVYKNDEDKEIHYQAFLKSLAKINELNEQQTGTATFAINQFADYTDEEMKNMHGLLLPSHKEV